VDVRLGSSAAPCIMGNDFMWRGNCLAWLGPYLEFLVRKGCRFGGRFSAEAVYHHVWTVASDVGAAVVVYWWLICASWVVCG
jgi:hypothetical protein